MALYSMKELLKDANEKKYGIGYFNVLNLEMIRALIEAAEETRSPIIIGTAEGLLDITPFEYIAPTLVNAAKNAKVPVAVHFDHCYSYENIILAIKWGFGSVMYDGSRLPYDENIKNSREISRFTEVYGVGLECELGSVGGLEAKDGNTDACIYTNVNQANEFVEKTKADFLAISIGTVHGTYTAIPKLDIKRLMDIKSIVDIPLVLHGGSGLSVDDFKNTIKKGISKVNIYTDLISAAKSAMKDAADKDKSYTDMIQESILGMKEQAIIKLNLFDSCNKA